MLTTYIAKAMALAATEPMEEGEGFFASISGFDGLWATGSTPEEALAALQSALEDWIMVGISLHHDLPVVAGIHLIVKKSA